MTINEKVYNSLVADVDALENRLIQNKGCYSLQKLIKEDRNMTENLCFCLGHDLISEEEYHGLNIRIREAFKAYFR